MDAHTNAHLGMSSHRPADLLCAFHRRFPAGAKNERAAIAGRETKEFAFRFPGAELLSRAHDLLQLLQLRALLADQQLRVTNDIEEENVSQSRGGA